VCTRINCVYTHNNQLYFFYGQHVIKITWELGILTNQADMLQPEMGVAKQKNMGILTRSKQPRGTWSANRMIRSL